jgi:two-component system, chemotaxis family, CheB/CheR fusion protein
MSSTERHPEFEALLEYLKQNRGFDFTGYKRASVMRRIQKRMLSVGIQGYADYMDHLEVYPEEYGHLFDTVLINVTGFFRDASAWEYLTEEILPRILQSKESDEPIRIWSAGCASGEEAYSLALILAEALGADQFRDRVKIYATDLDEDALSVARQATYRARDLQGIAPGLLERYFEPHGGRYVFSRELRRSVIFGRHDLIRDAPISRVDLLVCRNVLMYFNADTQSRVLSRFHFALRDTGYLFLGKAEMLLTHSDLFRPVHLKGRIFTKGAKEEYRERLQMMSQGGSEEVVNHLVSHLRLRDAAFDEGPVAQIVIDAAGNLVQCNARARDLFKLNPRDLGRPIQDLELSYRPVELRSLIEQTCAERRATLIQNVYWTTGPSVSIWLDVQVQPLLDAKGNVSGVSVSFDDVTRYKLLQEELTESKEELETAYEELQSTNEELETTNEELQSTIEELETTNEELQSTNEELETMNEELQSTNEELQTINEELRRRSDDLNKVNSFLNSILASLRGGVAVVDREMRVQIWNHRAEDQWGLRSDEVLGQHLLNLDIGLPVSELQKPLRACLSGQSPHTEVTVEAVNRRGKAIECKVTCSPLIDISEAITGAILLMEQMETAREP